MFGSARGKDEMAERPVAAKEIIDMESAPMASATLAPSASTVVDDIWNSAGGHAHELFEDISQPNFT